jgi:hypothetical protein
LSDVFEKRLRTQIAMPKRILKVKKQGVHCIWCADDLSVFKRIAQADFCSDEHANLYYEHGQRVMLQRLKEHRIRLQKHAPEHHVVLKLTA